MNFENILQIATLLTLLIGITGLLVKINGSRRQINASLFIEHTKRYDDIVSSFPKEAWAQFAKGEIPNESVEITICVYRFLHFLAGAFYFYRKGYIDKQAWRIWQLEIHTLLRSPLVRREWLKFENEHLLSPQFQRYVEGVQNPKNPVENKTVKGIVNLRIKNPAIRQSVDKWRDGGFGIRRSKTKASIRKSI